MNKRFIKKKLGDIKLYNKKITLKIIIIIIFKHFITSIDYMGRIIIFYTKCIHCLHKFFFFYLYGCFCRKIFFKLSGLIKLSIKIDVSKS